jgi:hypothetical protein
MRTLITLLICILLSSCKTTSESRPKADVAPINGQIAIGSQPIKEGVVVFKRRLTISKGGQSGSINTGIEGVATIEVLGGAFQYLLKIEDTSSSVRNLRSSTLMKKMMDSLIGLEIEYQYDLRNRRLISFEGYTGSEEGDFKILFNLVKDGFLGGKSITQGQEAFKVSVDSLMGMEYLSNAPSVPAIIKGQSIYNKRAIVIAKADGEVILDGSPMKIGASYFIDVDTGIPLFINFKASGKMGENNMSANITSTIDIF